MVAGFRGAVEYDDILTDGARHKPYTRVKGIRTYLPNPLESDTQLEWENWIKSVACAKKHARNCTFYQNPARLRKMILDLTHELKTM